MYGYVYNVINIIYLFFYKNIKYFIKNECLIFFYEAAIQMTISVYLSHRDSLWTLDVNYIPGLKNFSSNDL